MKPSPRLALFLALACTPAFAHIKLLVPDDWMVTDSYGDPQKTGPCGSTTGTASNKVTELVAGQKLKVQWMETVPHPGHFRISIAPNRADLVTPVPVVTGNDCKSAPIENPATAPTIMDGVLPHGSSAVGTMYEQEITVPTTPCANCTLQVLQFMSSHAPPCFYFHCANVKIVAAPIDAGTKVDAGVADSGVVDAGSGGGSGGGTGGGTVVDAGSTGGGTGGGSTGGGTGGTGGGSTGGGTGGGTVAMTDGGTAGGSAGTGGGTVDTQPGCGCNSAVAAFPLLLGAFVLRRRRA